MKNQIKIRYSWLKGMYIYTAIGAGLSGLGILLKPEASVSMLNLPIQEPINYGIVGSVYLAFGLISIFGLKSPLKFVPVLLLQMTYKIIWFSGVILPLVIKGQLPQYAFISIIIYATFIIGDAIAIPFKYFFEKN
ncbi:MAG: hypothetical protein JSV22_04465 [Bacteroidales bacterium]|nr:MAG: hypothetical protein JSV22_04465 [Bacteroidales bacterium]